MPTGVVFVISAQEIRSAIKYSSHFLPSCRGFCLLKPVFAVFFPHSRQIDYNFSQNFRKNKQKTIAII
jgi:hypothetical protein